MFENHISFILLREGREEGARCLRHSLWTRSGVSKLRVIPLVATGFMIGHMIDHMIRAGIETSCRLIYLPNPLEHIDPVFTDADSQSPEHRYTKSFLCGIF